MSGYCPKDIEKMENNSFKKIYLISNRIEREGLWNLSGFIACVPALCFWKLYWKYVQVPLLPAPSLGLQLYPQRGRLLAFSSSNPTNPVPSCRGSASGGLSQNDQVSLCPTQPPMIGHKFSPGAVG